jgi:D-amino-acid dehydrogenase
MGKKITILGGGIIGLSCAHYLQKSGHQVTIIDKGNLTDGCSFGNAGMIVPSHFIPLASPGMIAKGIRWMFNSKSPFYVKPGLNSDLIKWGWEFFKHSNKKHVDISSPALKELSLLSKAEYQKLFKELGFDFGYHERGLLMLYQNAQTEKEESEMAEVANKIGIDARVLSAQQVQDLEPNVRVTARGGVYFPGDAHLTPRTLVQGLIAKLKSNGVQILEQTTVESFQFNNQSIKKLITTKGELDFDELILAAGSWSGLLVKQLSITMPMQAGKGYSFTLNDVEKNIRIPSIFLEARVAVTPMGNSLRFGGTMEIRGVDHSIDMNRVRGIVESIPNYYPDMKVGVPQASEVWHGLRPCSPDGLPYIGRSKKYNNLIFATGHSMMGLSLAPATGKIISEIINENKVSVLLQAFNPERYN